MGDATGSQETSYYPVGDVLQQTDGGLHREDRGFESVLFGAIGVEVLCLVGRLVSSGSFSGPHPVCAGNNPLLPCDETVSSTPAPVKTRPIPLFI